MISPGDIVSHSQMCHQEGGMLQRGMYFRFGRRQSILLMSTRRGAPYADRLEEKGTVLIYEGHNARRGPDTPDPRAVDQPLKTSTGRWTQNGLFFEAAKRFAARKVKVAESVKVYEKIRDGIWVFNGFFNLEDAWLESSGKRSVFKFQLRLAPKAPTDKSGATLEVEHSRLIPPAVKREVWERDKGRCVLCGSSDNLHFDHLLPYSKGGTSILAKNIRLLCARHNLSKGAKLDSF